MLPSLAVSMYHAEELIHVTLLYQQPMIPLPSCLAEHAQTWMENTESLALRARRMQSAAAKPAAARRDPKAGRPMEHPLKKPTEVRRPKEELLRAVLVAVLIEPSELVVRGAIPALGLIRSLIGVSSMLAQSYER